MQGLKKEDLCQLLADRNANGWNIRNMLPALEQIALETEAERNTGWKPTESDLMAYGEAITLQDQIRDSDISWSLLG